MFAADPFYTNLLNEGKSHYLNGRYDEALDSFKIAEFGLLDEKEHVSELFYYYSLAQFRKGAIGEAKALLEKMKLVLGEEGYKKAIRPKEIDRDLIVMAHALAYLDQPGAKPGMIPFINLFYETWDLLKAKKLPEAEAQLKTLGKMGGDEARLRFLEGYLAFRKGDFKRCVSRLEKVAGSLGEELGEDAQFYLAYCQLKRGELAEAEKFAAKIKNPDYVHQLMALMDEIKAKTSIKKK